MNIGLITEALPYLPAVGGFRPYGANLMRCWSQRHAIHLVSLLREEDAEHLDWARPYCASIRTLPVPRNGLPGRLANAGSGYLLGKLVAGRTRLAEQVAASRREGNWDVAHVEGEGVGGLIAGALTLPRVLSLHDSWTLRSAEMLKCAQSYGEKLKYQWLTRYEPRYERKLFPQFDAVTVVAAPDLEEVRKVVPGVDARLISLGIDTEYFQPLPVEKESATVVFHGHLGYAPNIEAALEFANQILPLVRRQIPEAVFHLVGGKPGAKMLELASRPGIKVSADLADLRAAVCSARVYVCPIRYGSGLKNKMLEAMAMRLPIVGYPGATAGLNCTHGRHLLEAHTPDEFAAYTVELLKNQLRADQLATNARQFVEEHFSWPSRADAYEQLYQEVIRRHSHCM
jgi:glycosyltransferase involved in cell wall biosynthesis